MKMVSVIVPTFKRVKLLFYEIEQLKKQKGVLLDIIVVNDYLIDDPTDEIKKLYPDVVYIKVKEKVGPGKKHQIGMLQAKGEYVSFPDDDDYLTDEQFFHKAVDLMNFDSSLSFVSGNAIVKYEDEIDPNKQFVKKELNVKGKYDGLEYLANFQMKYDKPLSSFPTVFRKSVLEEQNFYDQKEMSDVSLYMLGLLGGNAYIIPDFVGVYRVHSRSLTKKKSSPVWIQGVMEQKESIWLKIRDRISHPSKWWLHHFSLSYAFFSHTSKSRLDKFSLLKWGFSHSHKCRNLQIFIIRKALLAFVFNK